MGLTGRYLGGLGCPVASRSRRLLSQGCGTQASAQLPLSQRGASGHMEPRGGIELQLPVVSLMPSLRRTDAFGLGCPGLWCGELSSSSALQARWDPISRAQSLCLKLPLPCPLSWLWPGGVSGWLVTPRLCLCWGSRQWSGAASTGSVGRTYAGELLVIFPRVTLSALSCSRGFLEAGSLPAGVCACSVNSNRAVFKDLLFHLAELGRTLECAGNCPLLCAALLESRTEPSWKGWEDESAHSVERAGLAWAAAEG